MTISILRGKRFIPALAGCLLMMPAFATFASISVNGMPNENRASIHQAIMDIPPDYDSYLLYTSSQVYKQLKLAREAALNKDSDSLDNALGQARSALDQLRLPRQVMDLDQQLGVIRKNLNQDDQLHAELWIPVENSLDGALLFSSDSERQQAVMATENGKRAASQHDRASARKAFKQLLKAVDKNLGAFPLTRVKQDLAVASQSAHDNPPYWAGSLEAIQSALATFHWYAQIPARGLLSAYTHAVNAYALVTAPSFRPDQTQGIINQLSQTATELKSVPKSASLQKETNRLIHDITPDSQSIRLLLQNIQDSIRNQRKKSEDFYMRVIASRSTDQPTTRVN